MLQKIKKWMTNFNFRKILIDYCLLTIGSIILAINFDIFLAPFNIAPGGVSGMAIILYEFTGWLPGLTMLVLTIPMLILGFYFLGRFRFLIRASFVTLIYSLGRKRNVLKEKTYDPVLCGQPAGRQEVDDHCQ